MPGKWLQPALEPQGRTLFSYFLRDLRMIVAFRSYVMLVQVIKINRK